MTRPGISLVLPGRARLCLFHLVLDYNGTLARRGLLLPGTAERLSALAALLAVHVVTADTFGTVRAELERELAVELAVGAVSLNIVPRGDACPADGPGHTAGGGEAQAKLRLVRRLGPELCCAVGNGANDGLMLEAAALSFCVMGHEGCAVETLNRAHVCVTDVCDALDMLLAPSTCVATLRR